MEEPVNTIYFAPAESPIHYHCDSQCNSLAKYQDIRSLQAPPALLQSAGNQPLSVGEMGSLGADLSVTALIPCLTCCPRRRIMR